jgi:hypothetical protein
MVRGIPLPGVSVFSFGQLTQLLTGGPASYGGPAGLPGRLNAATSKWRASGELEFLNEWFVSAISIPHLTHRGLGRISSAKKVNNKTHAGSYTNAT